MDRLKLGSPVAVKTGMGYKKGLFMGLSKTKKFFFFLHLPTFKVLSTGLKKLKRPTSEYIVWDNPKEYDKLVKLNSNWVSKAFNL